MLNMSLGLRRELRGARSYQEWALAAQAYDRRHRLDRWKITDRTRLYDFISIRKRLDRLRKKRADKDDQGLLFALNEGIHGNMGGMGAAALYEKARFGTKTLIAEYVDEIASALEYLYETESDEITLEEKVEFFHRASHCFGQSALMMSGAGSLFYFHIGVVKALWEQDILPTVLSGASGGALIGALVGTHPDAELERIFNPDYLRMEIANEQALMAKISVLAPKQIPIEEVKEMFYRLIPDLTFQEAYELTGRHINISVAPAEKHQTSRLLNALTSPNVLVREAVLASCSVPGLYPAVTLAAKNAEGYKQDYLPSRKWVDGSIAEDLPVKRLCRLYGVNHTIVSQTNPLVLPFVDRNKKPTSIAGIYGNTLKSTIKDWSLAHSYVVQRQVRENSRYATLINSWVSILSQNYTGDINILPSRRLTNFLSLLSKRTKDEAMALIRDGERCTWPQVERIRIQGKISRVLQRISADLEDTMIHRVDSRRPGRAS